MFRGSTPPSTMAMTGSPVREDAEESNIRETNNRLVERPKRQRNGPVRDPSCNGGRSVVRTNKERYQHRACVTCKTDSAIQTELPQALLDTERRSSRAS